MNKNQYAPIALFVYNRPVHTAMVIESLLKNTESKETHLIIFSDASKDSYSEDAVKKVREIISDLKGFKTIKIVNRKNNFGLSRSIISGVSEVISEYGSVIVIEDDLVVSPYFLEYMNAGLTLYRDEKRVGSIHGYTYPVQSTLPDTFFLRGGDCWGWATWERAWIRINLDGDALMRSLEQRGLEKIFNLDGSYPYSKMLKNQIRGFNDSWAIRWHASLFLENMLTLYPGKSLVLNIGHDGSGIHSAKTSYLNLKLCNKRVVIDRIQIAENVFCRAEFAKFLWKHHSSPFAIVKRVYGKIKNRAFELITYLVNIIAKT